MAGMSYTALPSSSYLGLGSQGDLYSSANYGNYDTGFGSLTTHPYDYRTYQQQQQPTSYSNDFLQSTYANAVNSTDQYVEPTTNRQNLPFTDYTTSSPNANQHTYPNNPTNQQEIAPPQEQQTRVQSEQSPPSQPPPVDKPRHQSQPAAPTKSVRSDGQHSKQTQPTNQQHSPSATTSATKTTKSPVDSKTTKAAKMRAAAIKQKEEQQEQKRKNGNFPASHKKVVSPKSDEDNTKQQSKTNKKQSNSVPKHHKSRREQPRTPSSHSSTEESKPNRNKSKKRTAHSDSQQDRYPPLPPIRRGRGPPMYDPAYDYPPPPPALRGRYPYYDAYPYYPPYPYPPGPYDPRRRYPPYEEGYDAPPYIAGYPDPYDGFFDYEKRKSKAKKHKNKKEPVTDREDQDGESENETEHETKSRKTKNSKTSTRNENDDDNDNNDDENNENEENSRRQWPYYNGNDMLELWRQERNDYLKKKYKPTVHDVLYSQQFMKSDSYVENQRRRALRDTQGYYFPYKRYTLKDYKDLQKQEAQHNPYAPVQEPTLDRKERVKKRQEYATQLERQPADSFVGQQKTTPRDVPPPKPWHFHQGDSHDPEKLSKRERALEYAKVQVVRRQPKKAPRNQANQIDPTEEYVNNLFPQTNDGSANERENNSDDEDDQ